MARARNIKPGFFTNDQLAECEYAARLLFAGLWCHADREGRLEDRPLKIKAQVFPYDRCGAEKVDGWLSQLAAAGFINRYAVNGTKYIQVNNFRKHQNPHVKEAASTIPAPDLPGASTGNSGASRADSLLPITDSLLSESKAPRGGERFVPPTLTEVSAYCAERSNGIDPQAFVDHYAAKGWHVGKTKMRDWRAAVRTWEARRREVAAQETSTPESIYPEL